VCVYREVTLVHGFLTTWEPIMANNVPNS